MFPHLWRTTAWQESPEMPAWRVSEANPADAANILTAMCGDTPTTTPAFATHFLPRQGPALATARKMGIGLRVDSRIALDHHAINMSQTIHIHLGNLFNASSSRTATLFMHNVRQAKNDGRDVQLMFEHSTVTLQGPCRPVALTQAINRMLASRAPPPRANCAGCRHYRRIAEMPGNQGQCHLGPPEPNSDCNLQGNHHWCPAHEPGA